MTSEAQAGRELALQFVNGLCEAGRFEVALPLIWKFHPVLRDDALKQVVLSYAARKEFALAELYSGQMITSARRIDALCHLAITSKRLRYIEAAMEIASHIADPIAIGAKVSQSRIDLELQLHALERVAEANKQIAFDSEPMASMYFG